MAGRQNDETLTRVPAANSDETRTGGGFAGSLVPADQTLTKGIPGGTMTHVAGTGTGELVDKVDWEIGDVIDGKYEVRAELGRGGMGMVYKVHHREWDIDMAVKMPLANLVADAASKARFIREAQTWVALGLHPHVVQCWYVRELGGIPRLFVDFFPGGSLKEWIRQGRVKPGEWAKIINLVIQACDGLSYAHEKGVVHRDVKPANMLMAEDGRLCVTDFGLVKLAGATEIEGGAAGAASVGGQHTLTVTGSSLGTPEYGAPEQWVDAKHVDARADIYALGIVLFELCVGRRPFDEGSHGEPPHVLIGRHLSKPAPDAREMNKDVPDALAAIIAKCLAKKPRSRPGSMTALRVEFARAYRHIVGEAYTREPPRAAELRADALNNRAVSLWDLGDKDAAFAGWAEALKLDGQHLESIYNKTLLEWREGRATDLEAVHALKAAKQANRRAGLYLGHVHLERAAADEAEAELCEALNDAELAKDGEAWRALGDAQRAQESFSRAKEAYEKALERMPDDPLTLRNLALASKNTRECAGRIGSAWLRCLCTLEAHPGAVNAVAVTPNGRFAVSGSMDRTLRLWELATRACLHRFHPNEGSGLLACGPILEKDMDSVIWGSVNSVAVTPDGRYVVSGSSPESSFHLHRRATIHLWDTATGVCVRPFQGHSDTVNAVAVTPDGRRVVAGSSDREGSLGRSNTLLSLWHIATGTWLPLHGHTDTVTAVAVTPNGRCALSGSRDKTLRVWDLGTGTCLRTFQGYAEEVRVVAVTPDSGFALSGSGKTLHLWDLGTGACLRTFEGHTKNVNAVAVTPDGRFVVSGSTDETVRLWEFATGACLRTFEGHTDTVTAVAVTPDGRFAISGSSDTTLRLWVLELASRRCRAALHVCRQESHAQAQSSKKAFDQLLGRASGALASDEPASAYHHLTLARAVSGYSRDPQALALNASLASRIPACGLRAVWFVRTFQGHAGSVTAVAVTPDGRFVVSGSSDKTLRLWDITTGACLRTFQGHRWCVPAVAVTPDGQFALSVSWDKTLRLWKLSTGACLRTFAHTNWMQAVAVTPDGRLALSGSDDKTLRLWKLSTGACLRTFQGHTSFVIAVAVTPDGRLAVSGSRDKALRLWEIGTGTCLRTYEGHADPVHAVAVTPDGRFVVSGSGDKTLRLWELATGACVRTFQGHADSVNAVAVTPDGRFVLSGSGDKTLRLWNLATGACVQARTSPVNAVAITPDGRFGVVGNFDGTLRLWELDWELDVTACRPVKRPGFFGRLGSLLAGKNRT